MGFVKADVSGDVSGIKAALDAAGRFDFSDYRRASPQTRYAMLAVASAADGDMSRWAVIGWNGAGCGAENRAYWDDYVRAGRETARASLFVPTLPSIPACEAAIAIGARGECCYYRTDEDTGELDGIVGDMFADCPETEGVIVVESCPEGAVAIALKRGEPLPHGFRTLKEVC